MNLSSFRSLRGVFLVISILGFLFINLPFLYFAFFDNAVYDAAMVNGVALVFVCEAGMLMLLFAWLIARMGLKNPGWFVFILLSLIGSLAFSLPLYFYLHLGKEKPLLE